MSMQPPQIHASLYHVVAWLAAAEKRETPSGLPIQRLRWVVNSTKEVIRYLLPVDPYEQAVLVSGTPPQWLSADEDDHGVGAWLLKAPCVLIRSSLDHERRLELDAVVVVTRGYIGRARKKTGQPKATLMSALGRITHLPKREQRNFASPDPKPHQPAPEGSDPNGTE